MSEVVALLLDDAMPADRLGALLRSARKRRGLSRKQAAAAAATTAGKLRAFERGEKSLPAEVCVRLAECYGEDLTAHVPVRVPPRIDDNQLRVGDVQQHVGPGAGDVIAGYVDIVRRLRDTDAGDPLALRTADIIALAGALGHDRDEIEERIADALGCTATEARRLHGELLRRKVILPVAGLAAGVAVLAGAAHAGPAPSGTTIRTESVVASARASAPAGKRARPARAARPTSTTVESTSTTVESTSTTTTTPATEAAQTDATVPDAERPADVPTEIAPPTPDPDDTPVSILPGETPITIIGTADSTVAP